MFGRPSLACAKGVEGIFGFCREDDGDGDADDNGEVGREGVDHDDKDRSKGSGDGSSGDGGRILHSSWMMVMTTMIEARAAMGLGERKPAAIEEMIVMMMVKGPLPRDE